ncbi:DUF1800 domain-containing protein [Luteipulveratus sp. YIM 133132]|uniref:DUF1800 domain-containing protein n=1 Tax=Luteipulveratus flavus TaxID=3031728 RepID=UPI0023AEC3A0|nr:DUF1800 domain-containing protein [Luteipulveratus sp. YIM 133132]MDE9365621.1 DUF1800 domain-containing protein [Luteipulveratus sp. YIM 133132]
MTTSEQWAAAARVVRSAGFGGSGELVDAVARQGVASWVAAGLATGTADPGATATPPPKLSRVEPPGKNPSQDAKDRYREQLREQRLSLTGWWLRRMVAVHHPLTEKLTFGWHNHFATSTNKVRQASLMLAQNEKLRAGGRGSFTALATALLTDPAMLIWLDGRQNTAKAPNENLAREFIELFALGHGNGYTENDVKEGARSLTGWTVDQQGRARLVPKRQDRGTKTVLGVTGPLDAARFAEAVLARPQSASYVATRWWRLLVDPAAPTGDALAALVSAYGTERDLSALFTAMLTSPAHVQHAGTLVLGPVEWVVGAVRALKVPLDDATTKRLLGALRTLGQVPFAPPNVSGWPSGQAWLSTSAAVLRAQVADQLARAGHLDAVAAVAQGSRVDATAHLLGIPRFSDRTATHLRTYVGDPRRLVAAALVSPENLVN